MEHLGYRVANAVSAALGLGLVVAAALVAAPGEPAAQSAGARELFDRGVAALKAKQYPDAASLFRLSYRMEPRAEAQCNLGLTYEEWGGHDNDALEAYVRCAADDDTGRFRQHAVERAAALRLRSKAPPVPPPATPTLTPPTPAAWAATSNAQVQINIAWHSINRTPSCFFFSGPGSLGRNDQLGRRATYGASGTRATLRFQGGQTFAGTRVGNQVNLTRRATYDGGWVVDETIEGTFTGNTLEATYRYQECYSSRPQTCPGNCTIEARLTARP